jgi:hypothetical protein
MSRITGSEVASLMEAYSAVYTPQELTEEQIQEDFENWVNSLVEEGHDLSEYTWEDMYEAYLSEIPINPAGNVRPISNAPYQSRFARPMNAGTPQTYGGGRVPTRTVRPQVGSLPSSARQVTQYPQGVPTGVGGGNAAASRSTAPAARPSAAPARPSAAPARPSASAAPTKPAAAKPSTTSPSYAGATGVRPVGTPVPTNAVKPVAGAPSQNSTFSAPSTPAKKPSLASQAAELRAMQAASRQRQGLTQSFDVFDVIKGHLIDEGYADTEEAALQIMANMSEEWRQSILEAPMNPAELERIAQQASSEVTGKKKKPKMKRPAGMRE